MKRRIMGMMVLTLLLVACASSYAAASGQYLTHNGTASYSYTTDDYVAQKNDTTLTCNYATTSRGLCNVVAVFNGMEISNRTVLTRSAVLTLPKYDSVRHVHLKIYNAAAYQGTPITTTGNWTWTA